MVVSQILVEHGHFLRKLLITDKQAQKSSVPPKFEAICHILVEHDHFYFLMEYGHSSNFGGTRSYSFFDGAWSLFKIFDGALSLLKFLWSMVLSQIFGHQSYHYR